MCGLAGFLDPSGKAGGTDAMREAAARMAAALRHRGPDDAGAWADADAGIALGHQRLSILDLSAAGHQPMTSGCGRYVIAYNGEVYNFAELRSEIEAGGHRFRGRSDTEVLVEAIAQWGVEAALKRAIGMFAFALWDREERTLTLARDRLGIKPLYWGRFGDLFLFGSELKALRAHPRFVPEVDRNALAAYLRFNYVPAPHSIYRNVCKLEPGRLLRLRPGEEPRIETWWDLFALARKAQGERIETNEGAATERLEALLRDAVKRRLVADVPLGCLLSGGVDSSAIAALMQAESTSAVKTFSIGFREKAYDEAAHARAVAGHLGTDHTELVAESRHALELVPRLPDLYDEPFADSSQIPTFLVSELTRKHVTVALSGDGGDELFAGYTRYAWARNLRRLGAAPNALRSGLAGGIRALSPAVWDRLAHAIPARVRPRLFGDRLYKLADVIAFADEDRLYRRLITHWDDPEAIVPGALEPRGAVWDSALTRDFPDFGERMQLLDTATYLPDDILAKVDRASMAVGLEARVPLLDHRVVELALRLPPGFRMRGGESKLLLRRVLYRHVPKELIERPKMGFAVPLAEWLRGPLRDWAEALLDAGRLNEGGFFRPAPIREKWTEHLSGHRNHQYLLWSVLMFEAWRERWG
jgi:asparagine synthase (glutamine-hydrolysing)